MIGVARMVTRLYLAGHTIEDQVRHHDFVDMVLRAKLSAGRRVVGMPEAVLPVVPAG